ncbi:MAG: prepilin-type N-terminal cleavage/methylation domain-containing protein [Helicobacteraceae bacterium]|nr:prepilin-type N-terminal cleavage/methylation domain-containing protein [Helicobacteraceae bacterium]
MKKQRKAFTLVEMMVSVLLMSILFTYLYGAISNIRKTNKPYTDRSTLIKKENRLFDLFSSDFLLSVGKAEITQFPKYDIVQFSTSNSLYQIQNPIVTYVVSKKENALLRIETFKKFKINEPFNVEDLIYTDILVKDTLGFNVNSDGSYFYLLLRAKKLNPMLLKLPYVSK